MTHLTIKENKMKMFLFCTMFLFFGCGKNKTETKKQDIKDEIKTVKILLKSNAQELVKHQDNFHTKFNEWKMLLAKGESRTSLENQRKKTLIDNLNTYTAIYALVGKRRLYLERRLQELEVKLEIIQNK